VDSSRLDVTSLYTIGSAHERVGCSHCFKTLDPNHEDPFNKGFVYCRNCNNSFHSAHISGNCTNCGSNQIIPAKVVNPPPLRYIKSRRAIEFAPIQGSDSASGGSIQQAFNLSSYWAVIRHAVRLAALGLLALVLVAVAAGLGAFTSRWVDIYQQSFRSNNLPELLLNAVLREDAPRQIVFEFAALAAVISAYALFPVTLRNKLGNRDIMRWIWRLAGGTILILAINVIYFNLNFVEFPLRNVILANLLDQSSSRELLLAQIGATIATTVLAVPYLIISRNPPLPPNYPLPLRMIRVLTGLFRYILVFYALICLVVSIGMIQLGSEFGLIISFFPYKPSSPSDWEARIAITALSALTIGLLIYHIPHYRINVSPTRPLNLTLRILGGIGCVVLIGLIYSQVNSNLLVEAAALGGGLAIVFCPTQRAYS